NALTGGPVYGINTVIGGSGDDFLVGSSDNDAISGGGGNDVILGMGGNDSLSGQGGSDLVIGGTGADHIAGGAGTGILIDGTTSSETPPLGGMTDFGGLQAVLSGWVARLGMSLSARISNLEAGVVVGGRTVSLNSGNVTHDASVDTLVASVEDWVWAA